MLVILVKAVSLDFVSVWQVRTIISREGIRRGMYAGYGAFMLRDLPFDAIEFVSYEQVCTSTRHCTMLYLLQLATPNTLYIKGQ